MPLDLSGPTGRHRRARRGARCGRPRRQADRTVPRRSRGRRRRRARLPGMGPSRWSWQTRPGQVRTRHSPIHAPPGGNGPQRRDLRARWVGAGQCRWSLPSSTHPRYPPPSGHHAVVVVHRPRTLEQSRERHRCRRVDEASRSTSSNHPRWCVAAQDRRTRPRTIPGRAGRVEGFTRAMNT